MDAGTNTVTATVKVGEGPFGVAVSPDGTKVYSVNNIDNDVSVIDSSTNTVTATIPVGNMPMYIAFGQFNSQAVSASTPTPVTSSSPTASPSRQTPFVGVEGIGAIVFCAVLYTLIERKRN